MLLLLLVLSDVSLLSPRAVVEVRSTIATPPLTVQTARSSNKQKKRETLVSLFSTQSRGRTGTGVNLLVFETSASTDSAIWASDLSELRCKYTTYFCICKLFCTFFKIYVQKNLFTVAFVVAATLARVFDKADKVGADNHLYIATATADNLDAVAFEFVLCSLTHIACEHYLDTHLLHIGSDARFATATLRRV